MWRWCFGDSIFWVSTANWWSSQPLPSISSRPHSQSVNTLRVWKISASIHASPTWALAPFSQLDHRIAHWEPSLSSCWAIYSFPLLPAIFLKYSSSETPPLLWPLNGRMKFRCSVVAHSPWRMRTCYNYQMALEVARGSQVQGLRYPGALTPHCEGRVLWSVLPPARLTLAFLISGISPFVVFAWCCPPQHTVGPVDSLTNQSIRAIFSCYYTTF